MRRALETFIAVAIGAIVAAVGSVSYRSWPWYGAALSILLVLLVAIFMRAWARWLGIAAFAIGWAVVTVILTRQGPGGSVLIAADGLGYAWLYGGTAAIVASCVLPPSWIGTRRSVTSA